MFSKTAQYYDLLYKEKDYARETQYIHELIQKFSPDSKNILEFGCGSGGHAIHFAELGYNIHGIDQSETMLEKAGKRILELSEGNRKNLKFSKGDICTIDLGQQFDLVVSLFHVMSYQTANNDLELAFKSAVKHLKPGGKFIFDCWYGPGVLTDLPQVRVKRFEDEKLQVTRIATPTLKLRENYVEVHFEVLAQEKATQTHEKFEETHNMRYLFEPEIEFLGKSVGFTLQESFEWLKLSFVNLKCWNACFVMSKN